MVITSPWVCCSPWLSRRTQYAADGGILYRIQRYTSLDTEVCCTPLAALISALNTTGDQSLEVSPSCISSSWTLLETVCFTFCLDVIICTERWRHCVFVDTRWWLKKRFLTANKVIVCLFTPVGEVRYCLLISCDYVIRFTPGGVTVLAYTRWCQCLFAPHAVNVCTRGCQCFHQMMSVYVYTRWCQCWFTPEDVSKCLHHLRPSGRLYHTMKSACDYFYHMMTSLRLLTSDDSSESSFVPRIGCLQWLMTSEFVRFQ